MSARWSVGTSNWLLVSVKVPPGPLGVLLDGDQLDRPVLEGFAALGDGTIGAVESSGRVTVGSLLVGVDERDFEQEGLGFEEVGEVLRESGGRSRTLRFRVPKDERPLSQQFAPRRGPPPREQEEEDEEEEEDTDEEVEIKREYHIQEEEDRSYLPLSEQFAPRRGPPPREEEEEEEVEDTDEEEVEVNQEYHPAVYDEKQDQSSLPLSQQFAPRRGPPPREEEESLEFEDEEKQDDNVVFESDSSTGDSFQEIHMADVAAEQVAVQTPVDDQASSSGTSWTLTGSKSPDTSSASSASPQKLPQLSSAERQQSSSQDSDQASSVHSKPTLPEEIEPPAPLPTDLSFGTMAAAQARHFDSDDSSDDDESDDDAPERIGSSAVKLSSFSPEDPSDASPEKQPQSSRVPLSLASAVSSGSFAASLMAQSNQFDDSIEDENAEYVTVVAPPGPLGLNLDGGVLDRAVVMGFVKLRDGAKGALERNGEIVPGSVLVRINGEDFSHATLHDVGVRLGELSMQPRTLVFRLPPRGQQDEQPRAMAIKRAPTLPPFEEDVDKRRKMELALVMRYDKAVLARRECWFCLDAHWMARWVEFVARGGPEPGPISNDTLLQPQWRKMLSHDSPGRPDVARDGLVLMKDYRVVAPMVWCLFAELHGLGQAPILARYVMDIHAEPLSDGELASVLEIPRPKAAILANTLRDKCLVRPSRPR